MADSARVGTGGDAMDIQRRVQENLERQQRLFEELTKKEIALPVGLLAMQQAALRPTALRAAMKRSYVSIPYAMISLRAAQAAYSSTGSSCSTQAVACTVGPVATASCLSVSV